MWLGVGCPCPPVCNDIVTPRHLFMYNLPTAIFFFNFYNIHHYPFIAYFSYWDDGTSNFPPPKSHGTTVMTSDFFSEKDGFIAFSDAAWELEKRRPEVAAELAKDPSKELLLRRAGSVLNVSSDGYYEHCRFQSDVKKLFRIHRANNGDEYDLVILLDHSPIHSFMAEDELNAKKMNVRPGGKQPIMKDGYFFQNGEKVLFSMMMMMMINDDHHYHDYNYHDYHYHHYLNCFQ